MVSANVEQKNYIYVSKEWDIFQQMTFCTFKLRSWRLFKFWRTLYCTCTMYIVHFCTFDILQLSPSLTASKILRSSITLSPFCTILYNWCDFLSCLHVASENFCAIPVKQKEGRLTECTKIYWFIRIHFTMITSRYQ